jgi:Arc/MetJ family transcription regulator
VVVGKMLVDVDEELLAAAAAALHTVTVEDTINAALREAVAWAERRRDLARFAGEPCSEG